VNDPIAVRFRLNGKLLRWPRRPDADVASLINTEPCNKTLTSIPYSKYRIIIKNQSLAACDSERKIAICILSPKSSCWQLKLIS